MQLNISPLSREFESQIQQQINNKTKPLGALGSLETLATQLLNIKSEKYGNWLTKAKINKPELIVFAGDHGIASEGISIAPSDVTQQMVTNFIQGGAAINVFCQQNGWHMTVVDTGMIAPITVTTAQLSVTHVDFRQQRLGAGTAAFHKHTAMTPQQVHDGLELGRHLVQQKHLNGCDLIAFGEMGIGNTSSASALLAAILNTPATETVGLGTGISPEALEKKIQVIQQALDLHQANGSEPLKLLECFAGFEIVQMVGAILGAAELKLPIIIDGFICTSAAMIASLFDKNCVDYFIFAHTSGEQGHQQMLDWLQAKPLLQLGMRLGEGTGAALSLPLIKAALGFYSDMASFEQAAVEDVVNAPTNAKKGR